MIVDANGIEAFVRLLQTGTPKQQTLSAFALSSLALNVDGSMRVRQAGGIQELVFLLQHGPLACSEAAAASLASALSSGSGSGNVSVGALNW